jgi:predicted kinase
MKLIIINGSSCSGKSTIIKNIMIKKDNLFHLYYDGFKWSFSNYSRLKHSEDIQRIVLVIAKEAFDLNYDVITDSCITREYRNELIDLAKQKNYEILEINLEVDFKILENRFKERVEKALKVPEKERRISNVSMDRFKELFDIYNQEKNIEAITFRSDIDTPDEISDEIIRLI